jgi:hypothetical protein
VYDLNKNVGLHSIGIDVHGGAFTNPVVTSYGKIVCLANLSFWAAGENPVHYQTWAVGEFSSDTFTGLLPKMYFMVDSQTAANAIDISGLLDVSALLIDESDNLFAVASDGVYSIPFINNHYTATKIYSGDMSEPPGGAYYDRLSKNICFIENIEGTTFFTKITTSGTLVSRTLIFINAPVASCGVMLDNYMLSDRNQLIDMTDGTFNSVVNIDFNTDGEFSTFFDGPINQGKINDPVPIICINYDTTQTGPDARIYFFDYLGDSQESQVIQ